MINKIEAYIIKFQPVKQNMSISYASPNDHIIYDGEYASENKFPQYEISRYLTDQVTKKVSRKVLRYIPIIPHFQ